jgi:hypothetical protein
MHAIYMNTQRNIQIPGYQDFTHTLLNLNYTSLNILN